MCAYARPNSGGEGWVVSLPPGYKSCTVPEYSDLSNEWEIDVTDAENRVSTYTIAGQQEERYLAFRTDDNDFVYARKAPCKNLMGFVTDEYMDDVISRLLFRLQLIES